MSDTVANYEEQLRNDILKYNELHRQELQYNFGLNTKINKNPDLASKIRCTIDECNNKQLNDMLLEVINEKKIRSILLDYELQNYKVEPIDMTIKEFQIKAVEIFNRYHWKAGGFYIEDRQWTIHNYKSTIHNIRDYELLFENSIDKYDFEDNETQKYLKKILRVLNSLSNNIIVQYDYRLSKNDGIVWLHYWCIDETKINKEAEVTL
jgi:hypothetical protein